MQNKPNFQKAKMNVSAVYTKDYENKSNWTLGENKPNSNPKQTQFKANFRKAKMNVTSFLTKDYENEPRLPAPPKQTQSNPISLLPKSPRLPLPTLSCASLAMTENGIDRRSVWSYLSSLLANEILRQKGTLKCKRDKSF